MKQKRTATLVLFCFYYEKYRPKHSNKVFPAHKTAENSHSWKSPYNALQARYWICTSCMPIDRVSVDALLIQVLITNIFEIGAMNAADVTITIE